MERESSFAYTFSIFVALYTKMSLAVELLQNSVVHKQQDIMGKVPATRL